MFLYIATYRSRRSIVAHHQMRLWHRIITILHILHSNSILLPFWIVIVKKYINTYMTWIYIHQQKTSKQHLIVLSLMLFLLIVLKHEIKYLDDTEQIIPKPMCKTETKRFAQLQSEIYQNCLCNNTYNTTIQHTINSRLNLSSQCLRPAQYLQYVLLTTWPPPYPTSV